MQIFRWLVPLVLLAGVAQGDERPAQVSVSAAQDHAVDGGAWSSMLLQSATPWPCVSAGAAAQCVEHSVVIDNRSPQTLECTAAFASEGGATPPVNGPDMPALVLPRTTHEIRGPIVTAERTVRLSYLDCRARPPYQRLSRDPVCKYEMFGNPFEGYYPAAAVTQALEGPVVIAFQLPERNGHATGIAVAESSLVKSLDEAATRFVTDQRFTTNCPGTRFDVRMRFTLRDRFLPPKN